ncbi:uncharacterized protein LOC106647952 [Copidosoma floridanum]|uniref:uncharacterized protein LOC106647952 n=1 Tax=Copidosoma floridanum TaxID=29053 RepID=UPI0006C98E3E|nr:uncharacterized protein LOC106647952 [Copidosoma floridanum]
MIAKLKPRSKRVKSSSESRKENGKGKDIRRRPFIKNRSLQKSKENTDSNNTEKPTDVENETKTKTISKPIRAHSSWGRPPIDFSLRLSNIASTVRVRDLKSALLERGVKPSNITWRGQRGFCYLHFGKLRKRNNPQNQPIQVDSIVANLQQLKIGDQTPEAPSTFITVEPAEPVSRIEVTDVTTV